MDHDHEGATTIIKSSRFQLSLSKDGQRLAEADETEVRLHNSRKSIKINVRQLITFL